MGPRENQSLKKFPLGCLGTFLHPSNGVWDHAPALRPSPKGAECGAASAIRAVNGARVPAARRGTLYAAAWRPSPRESRRWASYRASTAGRLGAVYVLWWRGPAKTASF